MAVLKLVSFGGVIPVSGDRALPDGFATASFNTWLYGKELRGVRPWTMITGANATTRKVFRIPRRTEGGDPNYPGIVPPPSYLGDSTWLEFADPDTDIVRGALVDDSFERWYFCSPTTGPMFNTYERLKNGQEMYKLGVPGPNRTSDPDNGDALYQPTITGITGGAPPVLTRAYVYTWVNEFGEESSPSIPVTGAGNTGATWNIGNIADPPAPALASSPPMPGAQGVLIYEIVDELGTYVDTEDGFHIGVPHTYDATAPAGYPAYAKKRLYRTITGTSGATTYFHVADIPLGTTTYADNQALMTDAIVAQNLKLESINWTLPPDDLQGIIAMPNGFLVGFIGNTIWMSEAFHFHAWPEEYKQTTEYPIVGLGVLGQTCVVCTQGFPATATGGKPAVMQFTKSTTQEPCMARGSIVSTPQGVLYASQNGLMIVGPGGIQNVTQQLVTREEWIRDYTPQHLRAVRYQNGYLALRDLPQDPALAMDFTLITENGDDVITEVGDFLGIPHDPNPNSAFFLDQTELRVALTEFTEFDDVVGIHADVWSGEVFTIQHKPAEANAWVYRWDPPSNDLWPVLWRSKEFQFPYNENFAAYAIHWDHDRFAPNGYGADFIDEKVEVRFRAWCNRRLIYDETVPRNGLGVRLPSGFKGQIWQFEVRARAPVYSVHIASTMKELKSA